MASDIKTAKKTLRKQIKQSLTLLDGTQVSAQSLRAQRNLLKMSQYQQAKGISVYLSMPNGEANTDLIVRDALQVGKAVYVPHMYKSTTADAETKLMDMLRLKSLEDYQSLEKDNWGIPTLSKASIAERNNAMGGQGLFKPDQADEGKLDMIIMPGVAFDAQMQRLGHGAGYYDSFLSRYNADAARKRPFLVGLCLAEQVLPAGENVPVTDHDWKVDAVVTGDGHILTANELRS